MINTTTKNIKKDREFVNILGIDVLSTQTSKLITAIQDKITHNSKFSVFTVNPEIVLASSKDKKVKNAINGCEFCIPDGIALLSAANYLETRKSFGPLNLLKWLKAFYVMPFAGPAFPSRLHLIKGRELFIKLIELSFKKDWRIVLLGGNDNEAEMVATNMKLKYPNLQIKYLKGPKLDNQASPISEVDSKIYLDVVDTINSYKPHMVFVAFGCPKQELWIDKNLPNLKTNMAMTVGGTFRYLSGLSKLPPQAVSGTGLEWLWRLITEPERVVRVFNAVFAFPLKVLLRGVN